MPGIVPPRGLPRKPKPKPGPLVKNPAGPGIGGISGGTGAPGPRPINVQALRTQLVHAGYNIPKTGDKMGGLMKSALRDYLHPDQAHPVGSRLLGAIGGLTTGKRDPKAWNLSVGPAKSVVSTATVNANGDTVSPPPADAAVDPNASGQVDATSLVEQLRALHPNVGKAISEALASRGATLFDPAAADSIAGQQYDPQIQQLGVDKANAFQQGRQNINDIGNWYDQVLSAEDVARGRDTRATAAGQSSLTDSVQKIIASLGGSANDGSASVGAAGASALGTLGAVGTAQDQYNNDVRPLLRDEAAGARTRQVALSANAQKDFAQRIASLRGERGQAAANAGLDLQNRNNGILDNRMKMLFDIRNQNNSLAQQRFGNQVGLLNTEAGLAVSGAKIDQAVNGKPPKDWAHSSPGDKRRLVQGAVATTLGPGGNPIMSAQQAVKQIQASLAAQGITDPAAVALAVSALRAAHPKWWAKASGGR